MALGILERPAKNDAAEALQRLKDENPNIGSLEALSDNNVSEVKPDDPMLERYNKNTQETIAREFAVAEVDPAKDDEFEAFMSTKREGMGRAEETYRKSMENYSSSPTAESSSTEPVVEGFSPLGSEKVNLPPATQKLGEATVADQTELIPVE